MSGAIHHGQATGIHPGAFVQPTAPATGSIQDRTLWVDTSAGPPYQLKVWEAGAGLWRLVGTISGVSGTGAVAGACLTFPLGGAICNEVANVLHFDTGASQFAMDATGLTLPGGHRWEVAPG